MDFILKLSNILIWPLTIIISVYFLRGSINSLIPSTKSIKYKDFELEFSQQLTNVSLHAQDALPNYTPKSTKESLILSASHLPNHSILQTWAHLDKVARNELIAKQPHITIPPSQPYKYIGQQLLLNQLISDKQAKLFHELRQLRNKVAHAPNYKVDVNLAVQYIELCFALIQAVQVPLTPHLKKSA